MSKSNYHKKLGRAGWSSEEHTERSMIDEFYDFDCKDSPSSGKKRSKKKQSGKKYDHKHKFEKVICIFNTDLLGRPCRSAVIGKRCSICGKLDGWEHPITKDEGSKWYRQLTYDEVLKLYKDLPVVQYK